MMTSEHLQSASFRYIVEGMACGTVSAHQNLEEAIESLIAHTEHYVKTYHDHPDFEIYDTVHKRFLDVKWSIT